jgi:hypothetical protein
MPPGAQKVIATPAQRSEIEPSPFKVIAFGHPRPSVGPRFGSQIPPSPLPSGRVLPGRYRSNERCAGSTSEYVPAEPSNRPAANDRPPPAPAAAPRPALCANHSLPLT